MGEGDERAQGCARSTRTKQRTMRKSESWACLLVAMWVRELRDDEQRVSERAELRDEEGKAARETRWYKV